jgi:Lon protease-like protein
LQGLRRFEIKDEIGLESYRQGSIELKDFAPLETKLPPELRADIMKIVGNFLLSQEDGAALTNFLKQPVDDETLVHNLSFGLDFTPLEKQFLLEADTVVQQARRLLDLLQFKRYERHDSAGWG